MANTASEAVSEVAKSNDGVKGGRAASPEHRVGNRSGSSGGLPLSQAQHQQQKQKQNNERQQQQQNDNQNQNNEQQNENQKQEQEVEVEDMPDPPPGGDDILEPGAFET